MPKNQITIAKQEWTFPACKGIWKESKADWIVLRICRVWMYEDCSVNEVRFLCELSHTEYLTHFRQMFHLCRNQVVSFYEQNV